MAYFQCMSSSGGAGVTITVTYDSSFYNKTMTCTKGTKTYTKTTTSSGSTTFSVAEGGTWTITCNGVSVNVTIVLEYSTQMKPDGATVTPTDNIQTWLKCGGVYDKNYTTIGQVLADTTTLLTLISDNNAVDYMVRSTTWASSVCANSTAMTDIGANNYCANKLLADSTWANAICNSTYFENVLNVNIPTMTSNTTPSGKASAGYGDNSAYKAFDKSNSTYWNGSSGIDYAGAWIQYEFPSATRVCKVVDGWSAFKAGAVLELRGSNDNFATYTTVKRYTYTTEGSGTTSFANANAYKYYRWYCVSGSNPNTSLTIKLLQFYGR